MQVDGSLREEAEKLNGLALTTAWAAAQARLRWRAAPILPESWEKIGREMRQLRSMGLYDPRSPYLAGLTDSKEFWEELCRTRTWVVAMPTYRRDLPLIPLLVQSEVPPEIEDHLHLAFLPSTWPGFAGEEAHCHISLPVVWPAIELSPADVDDYGQGALLDRAFFKVMPGSTMAGAGADEA